MAKKTDNFKGMSIADLTKKLTEMQKELQKIRFMAVGAKSKNVKEAALLKKQIARALTEMRAQTIK